MRTRCSGIFVRTCIVAIGLSALPSLAIAQDSAESSSTERVEKLTVDQVLTKLEERNAERAAALQGFEGTRIYQMQYRGFPSDRDAEMVVKVKFQAPSSKQFTIVSETGSKFVLDHIFKRLLDSEEEALKADNRQDTALTRQNYTFELQGYDSSPDGAQYVLKLVPKTKNKFLYRGRIWVDASDFAVVRIEGEPAKNPSFWIKRTNIAHSYKKVNDFWLPAENHTESSIRLGGNATLSIEYRDYRITKSIPSDTAKSTRDIGRAHRQGIVGAEPAVWESHIAILGSH